MTAIPQMTFEGAAGGMNAAVAPHEIGDNQGVYIQDILLHKPGLLVRRGPIAQPDALGLGLFGSDKPAGLVQAVDPAGVDHIGILDGNNVYGHFYPLNDDLSMGNTINLASPTFPLPGTSSLVILDSKPMLNGGTLIGLSERYELGGRQHLYLWRGGLKVDYTTGTVSTTTGSKTVTGGGTAWTSGKTGNISPGMFLILGGIPYGVVKSVDSGTQITLEAVSPYTAAGSAYTLTSLRGFRRTVRTGTISTSTASKDIQGSGTKFKSQGWDTNWDVFRASDMVYIGRVASVANDSGLTLAANALVSLANEPYVAWSITASTTPDLTVRSTTETPGFLNCIWDRKQWYGNLNRLPEGRGDYVTRIWASDEADPEAVDFSPVDGDFINIPSTKTTNDGLRALVPAFDSLVVLKATEAHSITGTTGNYASRKIGDDGALCGMSAVSWGAGVVWAGRNGIWFYDGLQAANITEASLGDFYKTALTNFNPAVDRMWGMVYRDHYILNIENTTQSRGAIKGPDETIVPRLVICVYLPTKAVSLFTNVHVRGSIQVSAGFGSSVWYLTQRGTFGWGLHDAVKLFESNGFDFEATESNSTAGPDFYFESKRYSLGDGMLKKVWRGMMMIYNSIGVALKLDTILGLNSPATTITSQFLSTAMTWDQLGRQVASWDELASMSKTWEAIASNVYQAHRVRFNKRSQHIGFRVYQAVPTLSSEEIVIGPWALLYKTLPGKV